MTWLLNILLNLLADRLGLAWARRARDGRIEKAGEATGAARAHGEHYREAVKEIRADPPRSVEAVNAAKRERTRAP